MYIIPLYIYSTYIEISSDVFLSKNESSGGKTSEASEGMEYDFCPVWSRVLIFTHCPIKLIYLWLQFVVDVVFKCLRQRSNGLKIGLPAVFYMYVFSWFHSV
jgi:hypothetical protein